MGRMHPDATNLNLRNGRNWFRIMLWEQIKYRKTVYWNPAQPRLLDPSDVASCQKAKRVRHSGTRQAATYTFVLNLCGLPLFVSK